MLLIQFCHLDNFYIQFSLIREQAELPSIFLCIFEKKTEKCPSEIMRMNETVTFMALRLQKCTPAQDRLLTSLQT